MSERSTQQGRENMMDRAMPAVKICGLTRLEDVLAAHDLGVWALGFVFAHSPRQLTPEAARKLVQDAGLGQARGTLQTCAGVSGCQHADGEKPGRPLVVGVFVDTAAETITSIVRQVGLDGVQLHGVGGPSGEEMRAALEDEGRLVLIIQAVPVDERLEDPSELRRAVEKASREADVILLDTRTKAQLRGTSTRHDTGPSEPYMVFGGTGEAFPWHLAREFEIETPLLVAGGIGPHNARAALAESGAWGIDVSSGVESSPGIKDARLMERLVIEARKGSER
jgi:phosphoribosylanthranilate isomerase